MLVGGCCVMFYVVVLCGMRDVIKVTTDNFIIDFRDQELIKSFIYRAYSA